MYIRLLTWMIALASVIGLGVYLYPFALPTIHQTASGSTRETSPTGS